MVVILDIIRCALAGIIDGTHDARTDDVVDIHDGIIDVMILHDLLAAIMAVPQTIVLLSTCDIARRSVDTRVSDAIAVKKFQFNYFNISQTATNNYFFFLVKHARAP